MANLENLNLRNNHFFHGGITSIKGVIFEGLENLKELDLLYNDITSVEEGSFTESVNLEVSYPNIQTSFF